MRKCRECGAVGGHNANCPYEPEESEEVYELNPDEAYDLKHEEGR